MLWKRNHYVVKSFFFFFQNECKQGETNNNKTSIIPLFVHAVGTTGMDAGARRKHRYASHCQQCGVEFKETTNHVAAHVTRYRCSLVCPWKGEMGLITTCKACNNLPDGDGCCRPRRAWFCRFGSSDFTRLRPVRRLWCWKVREKVDSTEPHSTKTSA